MGRVCGDLACYVRNLRITFTFVIFPAKVEPDFNSALSVYICGKNDLASCVLFVGLQYLLFSAYVFLSQVFRFMTPPKKP